MLNKSSVRLVFEVTFALLITANAGGAAELSDSMQLYFGGNYKAAQQQLTALIQEGRVDARLHYFRGLASVRLGDATSADLDFQKGAELEVNGAGRSVGLALQRVQGSDRLRLEKFRRMARLVARQRVQPVAPKPIPRDTSIHLAGAVAADSSPTLRLASEVPLRRAVQPDPFADDPAGLLAREQQPSGPDVPIATAAESDEAPVGTGVAATRAESSEDSANLTEELDVFAEDPFAMTTTDPQVVAPAKTNDDAVGIFGAVFRAIRKATIPQLNPGAMLPPGMGPNPRAGGPPRPPVQQFPDDSFPQDDPFENTDSDSGDFLGDEEDPFGL